VPDRLHEALAAAALIGADVRIAECPKIQTVRRCLRRGSECGLKQRTPGYDHPLSILPKPAVKCALVAAGCHFQNYLAHPINFI
jgi:hypothetical protein